MKRIAILEEWHELIVRCFIDERLTILHTKQRLIEAGCPSFQDRRLRAYLRKLGIYEERGRGKQTLRNFTCEVCQAEFTAHSVRARYCKRCVPDIAAQNRMSNHKLSQPQYDAMLLAQSHCCSMCERDLSQAKPAHIHIDHCHVSNKIRGIVCANCNYTIGLIESVWWQSRFQMAKVYLEKHSPNAVVEPQT